MNVRPIFLRNQIEELVNVQGIGERNWPRSSTCWSSRR
jgi:hypothetical protein